MEQDRIMAIRTDTRRENAEALQKVLTQFGCNIKVRLGLHEVSKELCANDGLILLEVEGDKRRLNSIVKKLNAVEYVKAQLVEM